MGQSPEIHFGRSKTCMLELDGGTVQLASVPELTLSNYPVSGLGQGELFILVTPTAMPSIVKVEASNRGTNLRGDEVEQIRRIAEGIFRGEVG